jgi:hypothetical protein
MQTGQSLVEKFMPMPQKKCKELLSTSHSNSNSNITNDVDLAVNIEKYDATTRQDYDKQRGTFIVTILMH